MGGVGSGGSRNSVYGRPAYSKPKRGGVSVYGTTTAQKTCKSKFCFLPVNMPYNRILRCFKCCNTNIEYYNLFKEFL